MMQAQRVVQWTPRPEHRENFKAAPSRTGLSRILCISDLQPSSDLALDRAVALGQQFQADVHILYASEQSNARAVMHLIRRHDRSSAPVRMEMFAEEPKPRSVEVRPIPGPLHDAIVSVAKQFGIDLLVMTEAGETPASMERIIRSVEVPVLIVRRHPAHPYRNIVVASDLSESSVKLVRTMKDYGCLDAANVTIVHGFGLPYRGLSETPRTIPEHLDAYRNGWRRLVLDQLREDVANAGLDDCNVSFEADLAVPIHFIEQHVKKARGDLLVAGASRFIRLKRILGKSITHQILDKIDCDVLIVP
jgi:universal stress protein E